MKKATVLGAGMSGLAAAAVLAKYEVPVDVFDNQENPGGRCRTWQMNGFTFDMGPSWYWMPDVMERFFNRFNRSVHDYFELKQLDPGFRVFFSPDNYFDISANTEKQAELFESIEKGAGAKLAKVLSDAKLKYEVGVNNLVYKKSSSIFEYTSIPLLAQMIKLGAWKPFHSYIRKYFKDPRLLALMEFPILFLGGTAKSTPSLYSLMNYSCFTQGTFYPMGGFSQLATAMYKLCSDLGVNFHFNETINHIGIKNRLINDVAGAPTNGLISSIDYHHFDRHILNGGNQNYTEDYWDKKVLSPSALIFYIGVKGKIKNLSHHNLFFDESFDQHAEQIYTHPKWPEKPLFYACCPSKTDPSVAPEADENLFLLMPLAPGLEDTNELRETYYDLLIKRLESITGDSVANRIVVKKSYCIKDFKKDYNSYKGNAYGLANTLKQTAFMRPQIGNKKIKNLFYCGQLTVPGPGVPPAIISGQVASAQLLSHFNNHPYETYI
ncbi:phytoene desaturase family protein [Reichenbachiella carrageenanivorans]|uniref:Phytoene desaturase family protein n=1 Tax=Reichenbachiella carrageenanivorans TaxID=2979869 RepID=A0ABY6CX02_9BACT|nr:phytoene desaturase family protein [Reichenbachiella carrageenanivorans]UXX78249.1 phytoene desaturase family protein [Reichenbachiella carrageenanivorans]